MTRADRRAKAIISVLSGKKPASSLTAKPQPRQRIKGKPDLTPGPKFDVQGTYRRSPSTGKPVPDTGDKITPPRMTNQKYQGKKWGKATPHESNEHRRMYGSDWGWGLQPDPATREAIKKSRTA